MGSIVGQAHHANAALQAKAALVVASATAAAPTTHATHVRQGLQLAAQLPQAQLKHAKGAWIADNVGSI